MKGRDVWHLQSFVRCYVKEYYGFSKLFSVVFIIVDGINECRSLGNVCKLLVLQNNIKALEVSRWEKEIETVFSCKNHLELTPKFLEGDIHKHIEKNLECEPGLQKWKEGIKDTVNSRLLENNKGQYVIKV